MSEFWKKVADVGKVLNQSVKENNEKIRKYEEIASKLSDEQLMRRFKSRTSHYTEWICYKRELIARGLITRRED